MFRGISVGSIYQLTCGSENRAWHLLIATLATEAVATVTTIELVEKCMQTIRPYHRVVKR